MSRLPRPSVPLLLATALFASAEARAQTLQLAPFAGYQFGGSFKQVDTGIKHSLKSSLDYGGTLDLAIGKRWRLEFLYSRQETGLKGGNGASLFDLNLERYMGGIVEEKGEGSSRYFGAFLGGVTRFVPKVPGFGAKSNFTLGVSLGIKHFFSDHLGMRAEVRGLYTFTETDGGVLCSNGTCLFLFGGSGLWQGDVSGGVILAF
jgi:Outer membrane protein beta-barrel domain